jgi:hypothetical protein
MKSYVFTFAVTLLWLATSIFLATTVHADRKVGVSYADYGSAEESNFMLASNAENGDAKVEETGRMLKKKEKKGTKKGKAPTRKPSRRPSMEPSQHPSRHPSMEPSQHPSNQPSNAPSPVLSNTIIRGPTTTRKGAQSCDVIDEEGDLNRYGYCQMDGITDPKCQSTNAVIGPFWINRDAEAYWAEYSFQTVAGFDAVCIRIPNDPLVSSAYPAKGFLQFWDDVDTKISGLSEFSFDYYIKSCATGDTSATCKNRIYLGIYTRSDASNVIYYDCRNNWYFTDGIPNAWKRAVLDKGTQVDQGKPYIPFTTSGCPPTNLPTGTTLQVAADLNYVLGTKNSCGDKYPYSINLGGTGSSNDSGLEVCFKGFRDIIGPKDITYTFEAVSP